MNGVLGSAYLQRRQSRREYIFRYRVRSRVVVHAIGKYLESGGKFRLLDLGAAEGLSMLEIDRLLSGRGDFVGIEFSPELFDQAPSLPGNMCLRRGDITRLDGVQPESYDVVSALAVLEHLKGPAAAVKNGARLLKKGGIFVATVPVPRWDRLASFLGLLKKGQHECDMNLEELKACFEEAGLQVLELGRFMWAPLAILPYLGVAVSPSFSLKVDGFLRKFRIFNSLCVNQYIIGRKTPVSVGSGDSIAAFIP